ncbi:MAG: DUF3376 domain-containing protein [Anaerolineae bacterium]|nr:DUF3376 domain-containing protein [Anaerolineae bacterium]
MKITAIRHELETRLFEKADLDQLITAIEQNSPEELAGKNRAEHEIYVQNRLKALLNEVILEKYHTLQTEEDTSAFLRRFDHFFRIRRLRYFINKLNVWLAEIEVMPEIDRSSAEVVQLVETLGSLKGKIYTFIEFYSHGAWQIWAQAPVIDQESVLRNTFGYVENRFDRLMDSGFKHLAFDMIGLELAQAVKKIQSLRPVQPYMPTPDNDEYYELQRTTAHLENMLTQCGDDEFAQCMERVFNTYEFLDMYLYPASILANIGEADPIEVIRVSPKDAIRYKDSVASKLAGEKLMHFSAFLKRSWRENDLLWGRLDAAEIIVKTILADDEKMANQVLDKLCPNIISEELTSIRDRRDVELTKALFDDRDQEQIRQILNERTALGETKESENFLTQFYDTGMQGFESVAQNYLLRTSAKSLRTVSRMFELRSAQNRRGGSLLDRPMRYLTILLNLPYIFLVTLGGAEESRRKRLINLAFIVGAILMVLHLIGGLSLRSELLLGLIALLLVYLRPHRLLGIALFILAAIILLLTAGILRINVELQNPVPITEWLNLLFSSN